MLYALIQNGQIVQYPYSISQYRSSNPNVSLPEDPTEQQLNEVGIYIVIPSPQPPYNKITQNCNEGIPENINSQWLQTWVVTDATTEEIAAREAQSKQANKQKASALLSATDWTTIPDVGNPAVSVPYLANVQDFVVYRNQVRQIAVTPPVTVANWPIIPDEVWENVPPTPQTV